MAVELRMRSIALLAGLLFIGCVSTGCATAKGTVGNKAITDPAVVAKIEKGKSLKADVKTLLGEPSTVDFTDAGFEKWLYTYMETTFRVSAFGGGGHSIKTTNLTIQFDKEGVVQNFGVGSTTGGGGPQDANR